MITYLSKEKFCHHREGEQRFGESAFWIHGEKEWEDFLRNPHIPFCVLGIPEDIGVRANLGRPGAWSAFEPALQSLCNIQHNPFLNPEWCALGIQIETRDLMDRCMGITNAKFLRSVVEELDHRVEEVMKILFSFKKIPMIVGGGHNNALPLIRALNAVEKKQISVLNIDAHADLRRTDEGRHSGNSFSYAQKENLLKKYFFVGYHENYLAGYVFRYMAKNPDVIGGISLEEIKIKNHADPSLIIKTIFSDQGEGPFGLELDMDVIIHLPSSARTSSGLNPEETRRMVYVFTSAYKPRYFHLCEAAPILAHRNADNRTGKLISFLITDFMKAYME